MGWYEALFTTVYLLLIAGIAGGIGTLILKRVYPQLWEEGEKENGKD